MAISKARPRALDPSPRAPRKRTPSSSTSEMADLIALPSGYSELLQELKTRIRGAQVQAAFAVSRELILLYWSIGRDVLLRQEGQGWGAKVIDRLAQDLQIEFPGVEGFSPRSLKYMRAFAAAWRDEAIVQQVAAQLPWGHHMVLLDRLKQPAQREWYLRAAVEYGWSRNILVLQIKSGLQEREGKALTNFQRRCRRRTPISPSRS
ncbi:MAG: hypothetical protein JWQ49_2428 [Edaphobacter sp.]|nr:hypothetical protein [Edaphobacter sp.]